VRQFTDVRLRQLISLNRAMIVRALHRKRCCGRLRVNPLEGSAVVSSARYTGDRQQPSFLVIAEGPSPKSRRARTSYALTVRLRPL
jgi:hypothetical protein